jgi:SAM-dependent methyltransferase
LAIDLSERRIEHERNFREAFVSSRLQRRPEFAESMDLTRFMHGGPARLLKCPACGLLVRDEGEPGNYATDIYDSALLSHLYPRYVRAFEDKRSQYLPALRNDAEVLELGSHLGAFLQTAEEWGWRPTGLDIGESTCAFARKRGLSVKRLTLDDYSPKLRKPEAIFIWNCFEQLEDPSRTLRQSYRLLDKHGLLLVRVPNADFYREQQWRLCNMRSQAALKLLGYNNLLGFPYLHGFTPATLDRLLRAHRFDPVATHNSSVIDPPYPQMSTRMRDEWRATRHESEGPHRTGGPWIEILCRKLLS